MPREAKRNSLPILDMGRGSGERCRRQPSPPRHPQAFFGSDAGCHKPDSHLFSYFTLHQRPCTTQALLRDPGSAASGAAVVRISLLFCDFFFSASSSSSASASEKETTKAEEKNRNEADQSRSLTKCACACQCVRINSVYVPRYIYAHV